MKIDATMIKSKYLGKIPCSPAGLGFTTKTMDVEYTWIL